MQKYEKFYPVRSTCPNLRTALTSGEAPQRGEFRLIAASNQAGSLFHVKTVVSIEGESGLRWLPTPVTFSAHERGLRGVDPVLNPEAWLSTERLRTRLFSVFAAAIASGGLMQLDFVRRVIALESLPDCVADLTRWVALIKQQEINGQITARQAYRRLVDLIKLTDSLENPMPMMTYGTV